MLQLTNAAIAGHYEQLVTFALLIRGSLQLARLGSKQACCGPPAEEHCAFEHSCDYHEVTFHVKMCHLDQKNSDSPLIPLPDPVTSRHWFCITLVARKFALSQT